MTHPSPNARPVHIGAQYRPQRFEVRTPISYSARLPELSRDAERLQSGLLRRPICAAQSAPAPESALLDSLLAWASVSIAIVALAALYFHWI